MEYIDLEENRLITDPNTILVRLVNSYCTMMPSYLSVFRPMAISLQHTLAQNITNDSATRDMVQTNLTQLLLNYFVDVSVDVSLDVLEDDPEDYVKEITLRLSAVDQDGNRGTINANVKVDINGMLSIPRVE